MISVETLKRVGVPSVRKVMSAAMECANRAVSSGSDPEAVLAAVSSVLKAADPVAGAKTKETALPGITRLAEEFAAASSDITRFTERAEPAPWKSWAGNDVEEGAIAQMRNACRLPVSAAGALMPDAHQGYGLPIGGVLAVRNAVIPFAVGVDIACRMRISILDIPYEELDKRRESLKAALEKETRFGVGARFEFGHYRTHAVLDENWSVSEPVRAMRDRAWSQLGSSGSGNHFVEFGKLTVAGDIDEPTLQVKKGTYLALLSHSGSRGAGEAVAKHFSALAASLHPELPQELKHLAWLDLDSNYGEEYWRSMELMGRYASANHELIHENVLRTIGASAIGMVENHHNFAWKETYGGEELIIHRKGATPAGIGVLGVVPGSMGAPGFIVRGKGNPESFASCSHGAGRRMSRAQAFRTLSRTKMLQMLSDLGIDLISGPLDESPEAYKPIAEVMASQSDLVDVLAQFDPKIVKMADVSAPKRPKKPMKLSTDECIG